MIESTYAVHFHKGCSDQSISSASGSLSAHNTEQKQTGITITKTFRTCEVIEQPDVFIAKAKRCLSYLPRMISVTLRLCTTALSVSCFAGYYVSAVTITAASALIGVLTGLPIKLMGLSTRSVVDCAITFAGKAFEWLSVPYERIPSEFNGAVIPAALATALFLLETLIIPVKRVPIDVYLKLYHGVYQFTKPFQAVTDLTEGLFKITKKMIMLQLP